MVQILHIMLNLTIYKIDFFLLLFKMDINLLNSFCQVLIKNIKLHPVKLELLFNENIDYEMINEMYNNEIEESGEKRDNNINIENYNWNSLIKDKSYTNLYMYSDRTGNYDNRGGGCGEFGFTKDDFIWKIENKNGINLKDIVEGCYRLKGSKYDFWYELFCGLKEENIKDSTITYKIDFDYGS